MAQDYTPLAQVIEQVLEEAEYLASHIELLYRLTFSRETPGDDGTVEQYGVTLYDTDTMSLIDSEGGGGYVRVGPRQEPTPTPSDPDAAIRLQLTGNWCTAGIGGIIYADYMELHGDGTCTGYVSNPLDDIVIASNYLDMSQYVSVRYGTWHAGAYDPALGLSGTAVCHISL